MLRGIVTITHFPSHQRSHNIFALRANNSINTPGAGVIVQTQLVVVSVVGGSIKIESLHAFL